MEEPILSKLDQLFVHSDTSIRFSFDEIKLALSQPSESCYQLPFLRPFLRPTHLMMSYCEPEQVERVFDEFIKFETDRN